MEILNLEEFRNVRTSKPPKRKVYNPQKEQAPTNQWTKINHKSIHDTLDTIHASLVDILRQVDPEDKELRSIASRASCITTMTRSPHLTVAVTGEQGTGKSLFINALLDQGSMGLSAAAGKGCTSVPIEYYYSREVGHNNGALHIEVIPKRTEDMENTLQKSFDDWFYLQENPSENEEERSDQEMAAEAAKNFLQLLSYGRFDEESANYVGSLLTIHNVRSGVSMRFCLRKIIGRMTRMGLQQDRPLIIQGVRPQDFSMKMRPYITDSPDGNSLWYFTERVKVHLPCRLLENSLNLFDLPGFGDSVRARTYASNALAREADVEIIVTESDRVLDNMTVSTLLKRSIRLRGAANTVLVMTKIDNFLHNDQDIVRIISERNQEPFPRIQKYMRDAEDRRQSYHARADTADEDGDNEDIDRLSDYINYLTDKAKVAFIEQRGNELRSALVEKCREWDNNTLPVFSISSQHYLSSLQRYSSSRGITLTVEQSGVPALRRHLLSLPAEQQYNDYNSHVSDTVPSYLLELQNFVGDIKESSSALLQKEITRIRDDFFENIENVCDDKLRQAMNQSWAPRRRPAQTLRAVEDTVTGWSAPHVKYQTFNKRLQGNGIPVYSRATRKHVGHVNWNDDLLQAMMPDIEVWHNAVKNTIMEFVKAQHNSTLRMCKKIRTALRAAEGTPEFRSLVIDDWAKKERNIHCSSINLELKLQNKFDRIYKYLTTETDLDCPIAKLNKPIYRRTKNIQSGLNRYKALKKSLLEGFLQPDADGLMFPGRVKAVFLGRMTKELVAVFCNHMKSCRAHFTSFSRQLDALAPEGSGLSEKDLQIRRELKEIIPDLISRLTGLKDSFQSEEMEDETSEKRLRSN